ncbi:MAG: hypothetical protein JWQ40_822 [Segetibacter sp.]|nr:hypothetical protein [Segetibacter sp.]
MLFQARNETAHSFPRSLIKLVYYCGAATFGFHAYSFEETSSLQTIFLQCAFADGSSPDL